MEELKTQLNSARSEGNDAFKQGGDAAAVKLYSTGIDRAWQAGVVRLDAESSGDSVAQLVATLYANRAAAGLRLLRYEQVIHDATHAAAILLRKGCSDSDVRMPRDVQAVYGKARVRRATAFEALGNYMQASCDYSSGGQHTSDTAMQHRSLHMAEGCHHPIRYGMIWAEGHSLPPPPPRRSSTNVDGAVMKRLKCQLPPTCIFMQCAAWGGRIYCYGGGIPDPLDPMPSNKLTIVSPQEETLTLADVKPDPDSRRRHGLAGQPVERLRHSMVLWQDALYVYGGELETDGTSEARTVWRLDLSAEPLTWQRLYMSGAVCPPLLRNHSAAVWKGEMVVSGGESQAGAHLGSVWAFDLVHHRWRQLAPTPPLRRLGVPATAPEPRREHASWVHGDWLYIFGGVSNAVQSAGEATQQQYMFNAFTFPSMWRFSLTERRWEQVHYRGNFPSARGEMGVAVSPRGIVYLAGGYTTGTPTPMRPHGIFNRASSVLASAYSAELFEFCCTNHCFRRVLTADMQPPLGALRAGPTACWLDGQVHVMGGYYSHEAAPVSQRSIVSVDMRACAHCGVTRAAAPGAKLQRCSRCKEQGRPQVYYCSQDCMSANWSTHRILCGTKGLLQ